ncbi:MAG: polysaccharide deacetylase family protein [Oscillospiraceae bacterium]|nr:polysaccharide deacetylase family protein [Oscillospiraceae bacterium]
MKKLILTAAVLTLAGISLFLALSFQSVETQSFPSRTDAEDDLSEVTEPDSLPDVTEVVGVLPQRDDIDPSKPMIALTFDDGPSVHTERILDTLEKYNSRATFCVVGIYIEDRQDTVKRAFDLGCEIIGHSWAHDDLTKLSAEEIRQDLLQTNEKIESVIGTQSMMFRPPYGNVNDTLKSVSRELGLAIMTWSVDPRDWSNKSADEIYNSIMSVVKDRGIILSHDRLGTTADAMERIIPDLIAQGYQIVTISELMHYSDRAIEAGVVYSSAE